MSRPLTRRERDVLALLIDRAAPFDPDEAGSRVSDADRTRWRSQLRTTRAGRPCGCGSCPSVELTSDDGGSPGTTGRRTVLGAESDEALLLLFVDDDRLSYLELAPTGDRTFLEFPDPADVRV